MKKSQIKKLDTLWSNRVKEIAGYKCEHCKESGRQISSNGVWLNACHIIGRRYRGVRWSLLNGMCLCYVCHRQYDEHGPEHNNIMRRVVGKDRMNTLKRMSRCIAKNQDYDEIKRSLEDGIGK